MCVSVDGLQSHQLLPNHRHRTLLLTFNVVSVVGAFGGICGPGSQAQPAMAPALTQATHQRQTQNLHPEASPCTTLSSKLDTLTSSCVVDEQLVWSPRCCTGAATKSQRLFKKEIARSEEVSRGDGREATGGAALDPPPIKSQALASTSSTKPTTRAKRHSPSVSQIQPHPVAGNSSPGSKAQSRLSQVSLVGHK